MDELLDPHYLERAGSDAVTTVRTDVLSDVAEADTHVASSTLESVEASELTEDDVPEVQANGIEAEVWTKESYKAWKQKHAMGGIALTSVTREQIMNRK